MSLELMKNLNPGIADLHPYEPGRSIDEVMLEYGLTEVIKLASNENPLGASPKALNLLKNSSKDFHLYPDGNGTKLKKAIAIHEKLSSENIILGNGSNEVLELAARAFLNPGSSAIASCHAFAVYKIVTQSSGATLIEVPTKNWGHDLQEFPRHISSETKIIFIANPNNPTGTYNTHQEVYDLLAKIPASILVVLDCAYFEYVEESDYVDPLALLAEFDNLMVTKSFSKIHGLASARIGYGLSNPALIEVLNRIRQPFNVNALAQDLACAALEDKEHSQKSINLNRIEGLFLLNELTNLGLECIPSVGNFISFKGEFNGQETFKKLMARGVIVRPIDLYDMPNFLRVTIGTHDENLRFLEELASLL